MASSLLRLKNSNYSKNISQLFTQPVRYYIQMLHYNQYNSNMDYPFIEGLSDIQETQILGASQTTLPGSIRNHNILNPNQFQFPSFPHIEIKSNDQDEQPTYCSLRDYVQKTLNSWGLKIGYLPQNSQNKLTIHCIMQLISQKFTEQDNREQLKKSLSEAIYSRNKFQSMYEQQKIQKNDKNKLVGKLQNALEQMKLKNKLIQAGAKKQKQQDKKTITMLKSKNQQIMHQIKKRQQQFSKMKEQMKKNVGEKSILKCPNFQIYQSNQSFSFVDEYDKIQSLTKIYESQRKNFMKQNLLLRQKIYDIREELVNLLIWILQTFYQNVNAHTIAKSKMLINHNLLFKKQSLVTQLKETISQIKMKINEIIAGNFDNFNHKCIKNYQDLKKQKLLNFEENISPNKVKQSNCKKPEPRNTLPNLPNQRKSLQINSKLMKTNIGKHQVQPEDDSQLSIISQVSAMQIMKENNKFDRWEILFNND